MPFISSVIGGTSSTVRRINTVVTSTLSYVYTGSDSTYTVPAGVTSIEIYLWGAGGTAGGHAFTGLAGGSGGGAGSVQHTSFAVTPGETLTIRVGQSVVISQVSAGTVDATGRSTTAFGGGGAGGIGDGAGTNASFGSPGGGATSILRSGVFVASAAGGGGGGGPGYPATTGGNGGPGGAGNAAGGLGPGANAGEGANGVNGGGGGGGGGSGGTLNAGSGVGGNGGTNLVPAGGTGFSGSGVNPANTGSPYYSAGIGRGGTATTTVGADLSGGDGLAVIRVATPTVVYG